MTDIPGIISGSTIPSQDTWNEYIKVTANMTKTAIKLRCKKHLHQNMMKHFAMKLMRETLGAKDDLSEEMIENMGMEEMLSNLEGDYKIETLEKQIESNRKRVAARVAAMSAVELENYRESNRKRVAARVAAMSAVELENYRESYRKRVAARVAAMSAVELENYRESNQKRVAARVAAMSVVELENFKASKRKRDAARNAAKREDINAQRRKRLG